MERGKGEREGEIEREREREMYGVATAWTSGQTV